MTTQRTLKKWFQDPIKNADKIIENHLEWGADRCEYLVDQGKELDAVALYEEYNAWVNPSDNEEYGYLILELISDI